MCAVLTVNNRWNIIIDKDFCKAERKVLQERVYEFKAEFMNGKILKNRKRCRKLHDRDRIKKIG